MVYTFFWKFYPIIFSQKIEDLCLFALSYFGGGVKKTLKKLSYSMYYWVFRLIGNFFFSGIRKYRSFLLNGNQKIRSFLLAGFS